MATLPGDYGFDPFGLGKSDSFFALIQPGVLVKDKYTPRDSTTILRDYRDAELRHGRLAMLAALAWPVQVRYSYVRHVEHHGSLLPPDVILRVCCSDKV